MKFKKILCGVTAALTVLSSTAITAQAEETQLKLLTANFSDISDGEKFYFFGNGYLTDGNKFFKISEEQIAEWSKTGKISVESVEADLDVSGLIWWTGDFEGGYVQFVRENASGNITERYVARLNKDSGKIETAYKLGSAWCYTRSDGYTVLEPISDVGSGTVSFTVTKPDGTNFTSTLKSWVAHMDGAKWDDYVWFEYCAVDDEDYCLYVVVDEKPDGSIMDERIYAVYAIDKQGNAVKIAGDITATGCGGVSNGIGNNVAVSKNMAVSFVNDTGAFVLALSSDSENTRKFDYYGSIYYIGDNRAVGVKMGSNEYDLIDLSIGNVIASYPYIQAIVDNLFLVVTNDNKQGFIDGNNNVLGMFDIADTFYDEYAPVVKDGKAYLIDRNMNCVSSKIDGDNVYSFMGGLYRVDNGDSNLLVTYTKADDTSKPDDTPSTTSSDVSSTTSSETSSDTNSSESSNAQTGGDTNPATGAAVALIPIALIGGAAVVASKKRRK